MTITTRCEHCHSPAVEHAGIVRVVHLSWCPRAPRSVSIPLLPPGEGPARPDAGPSTPAPNSASLSPHPPLPLPLPARGEVLA